VVAQRDDHHPPGRHRLDSDVAQDRAVWRIDAKQLITHRFKLGQILQAYETFGKAADTKALKVIIEA
jgi:threonine dehydrogenase-like Zn-dependent dehydrogenase